MKMSFLCVSTSSVSGTVLRQRRGLFAANALVLACALSGGSASVRAADITVQPSSGSGFVVKDAAGTNERLRVQESGVISLPGVAAATAQTQSLCFGVGGQLGPCSGMGGGTLPVGTTNQTLRYNAGNALVANSRLQASDDGGLVASGELGTGAVPATGAGVRMMWYPAKAAFRVGSVSTFSPTDWDDANIGQYSIAFGDSPVASGFGSMAWGGNTKATGSYSTAAGLGSVASGERSTAMGAGVTASGRYSTAMGYASTASGDTSVAIGDAVSATGTNAFATGYLTIASGASSTAMGTRATTNGHPQSFVYGDGSGAGYTANTADRQFLVKASGGVQFLTNADSTSGVYLSAGSGSWANLSDRNAKTAVHPVDAREVLRKVVELPVNTWQYKAQEPRYRHIGPMAQDFYAAFHLGETDTGIDTVDADGIALAAIQGLNAVLADRLADKDREISDLRAELEGQKVRVASLEAFAGDLAKIKKQLAALRKPTSEEAVTVALRQP